MVTDLIDFFLTCFMIIVVVAAIFQIDPLVDHDFFIFLTNCVKDICDCPLLRYILLRYLNFFGV